MSREALVLLVCCCDFRDGAERLIPSKSLRNAVIRAFPGLFCILRMCAPRRAAAVVRPRGREKSADRRRRILISRLLIIRASVPRRKSPFPAYFKGFPAVSPLIPPYPAFLKYPVSPQTQYSAYFLMPPLVLFWIFFFVLVMTQIVAFRKGLTPYLKWCCVFSMAFGMLVYFLAALLGNRPLGNALRCAWLAIGNVWMFGGLLVTMKKAQRA